INAVTSKTKGFGQNVNPMSYATTTSRALPAYDENGDLLFYRKSASYLLNDNVTDLGYNFINERDNSGSSVETSRFNATLDFSWDITDWLKYQFMGGYTRDNKNNESYRTEKTFGIAENYRGYDYNTVDADSPEFKAAMLPFGGELFTSDALQSSYNIQNKLLISKSFNPDNRLNIMVAMELRSTRFSNNSNTVWGYAPDRGGVAIQPTPPDELVPISNTSTGWGILRNIYKGRWKKETKTDNFLSFFGTFAYSLKNRYIANVTIRNDASNRYGQDANNRFDPTYSFGLSWHVTEEDFMR
ncbi:MAG: SusC/RagA family TonB-linked outer membrane protein, partial [Butyricimonas faecihominis]